MSSSTNMVVQVANYKALPDERGHFGIYGGRYVPEMLFPALEELEAAYLEAKKDPAFHRELQSLYTNYSGRPTPLYFCANLSQQLGGG